MAVEQMEREGRLDLQRNSTEDVEGWGEDDEEEEDVVVDGDSGEQVAESRAEGVQEVERAAGDAVTLNGTCDTETVKAEEELCNISSSTSHDGGEQELERLMDSSPVCSLQQGGSSKQQPPSVNNSSTQQSSSINNPSTQELNSNPSLLQEMRTSLVEAQEEATTLLRQIQGGDDDQ